jgi:hypothetical protein
MRVCNILNYEEARHGIPKLEASGWKCILSKALRGCYRLHGFYYVWYKNEFGFSLLHCVLSSLYDLRSLSFISPLVNLSLKCNTIQIGATIEAGLQSVDQAGTHYTHNRLVTKLAIFIFIFQLPFVC